MSYVFKKYSLIIGLICISLCGYLSITKNGSFKKTIAAQETQLRSEKKAAFNSVTAETALQNLTIQGSLPTWLKGTLLGTGPARFEYGNTTVDYWFNGLALLHGFYCDGVNISYHNKFLDSEYYQRCQKNGKFDSSVSKEQSKGLFSRFAQALSTPEPYDNANLAVVAINNSFVALTETTLGVQFNPKTLKTEKAFDINEHLEGHLTTAQFQYDPQTKTWYNYLINFAQNSSYTIYKIGEDNTPTAIISLPVKKPSYMRSFAMTNNYIILIEVPFVINPMDLIVSSGPFIEKVQWKPKLGTNFIIVNKHTGEHTATIKTEKPFFIFNTVNAFEENNTIYIDAITYENDAVVKCITLDALRDCQDREFEHSYITRFTLDTTHQNVTHQQIASQTLEFPTLNQHYSMKPYNFVYGLSAEQPYKFPHQLTKINVKTGNVVHWAQAGCYASKPTFVAHPKATKEDEGVLLSVVFDSINTQSFLLILDAATFKELARATLPCIIPLGLITMFNAL